MTQSENKKTLFQRLNLLFLIIVLSGLTLFLASLFGDFLENLNRFIRSHIYVEVSKWDIPVFIMLPGYIIFIFGLFLRLIDQETPKRMNTCLRLFCIFGIAGIIVRIPYGFITSYYLNSKGYSLCWHLSRHQLMSPAVWVRDPGYCIDDTGNAKTEILAWMDTLPDGGKGISPDEVKEKSKSILELYINK